FLRSLSLSTNLPNGTSSIWLQKHHPRSIETRRTMRHVDRLILGTANFHDYTRDSFGRKLVAPAEARSIIDCAITCGIGGFDCADGYGFGQAEAVLGSYATAIRGIGPMSATTKIGFNFYNRRYLPNGAYRPLFRTLPTTSRIPFDTGR